MKPAAFTVIRATAHHFGLEPSDITGPARYHAVSRARRIAAYLCRELTGASYPMIANALRMKSHHSTLAYHKAVASSVAQGDEDLILSLSAIRAVVVPEQGTRAQVHDALKIVRRMQEELKTVELGLTAALVSEGLAP